MRCARPSACVRSVGFHHSSANTTLSAAVSVMPLCARATGRAQQSHKEAACQCNGLLSSQATA